MKLRDGSLGWSGDKGHPGGAYMYVGNAMGEGRAWADKEQCRLRLMGLTKLGVVQG